MEYFDIDGNPTTLYKLVRTEPEWAASRIRRCEELEAALVCLLAVTVETTGYTSNLRRREALTEMIGGTAFLKLKSAVDEAKQALKED